MPHIIGIDLGTTNTAVAVLENGRPRVIEDDRGYKVLPSVVSAKGEGRFVVGQAAHSLILTRPERTVYAAKRLMGRRFDSPEVQRFRRRVNYVIREAPDGGVQLQVGDAWMTPQEVAAVILQVARGIAEKGLGGPVEEAVITVPAHFNHAQRKATLEAAEIAGLRCERLLNEPTAAALAYGHRKNVERTLVIFDLGGGTFDVSVLKLANGIYEILATNGDTFLGGEDFDYRIVDHLVDTFKTRTNVDIRTDKAALQRVKDAAERAKCELSFSDRANVVVPHLAPGHNLDAVLTRTQLETLTGDLVDKCVDVARDAVVEAGLTIAEIDEVILVGGQTRMPRVREAVAGLFGREPSRSVHPEEAVAIGAAVHAATLGDVEGTPAVLLDITPFDLGIDAAGGLFSRILPKNSRVPCSESRTFATVHDNQTTVKIVVRQGEGRTAEENEFLGEFLFEGLPEAPRMQTKVAVTFRIDANGMLHVTAMEPGTGEKRAIGIRSYADHNRELVRPAAPARPGTAPALQPTAKVQRKKGFFDALFGGKKAPAPGVTIASAPLTPAAAAAAVVDPVPVIAPLPAPEPVAGTLAPVDDLELAELDAEEANFEMPEDYAEDDLYEPATASFGLAGAHQVGAAAPSGDLFGDVSPRASQGPTIAPGEGAEENALASSLDADDLFGDAFGEDDPPTNPGLRRPAEQPAPAPAPAQPQSGLLFSGIVESEDDMGFTFDENETDDLSSLGAEFAFLDAVPAKPASNVRAPASPTMVPTSIAPSTQTAAPVEDDLGFSFEPAPEPAAVGKTAAPVEDDLGFSFDPASEADDLGFSFEPAPEAAAPAKTAAPVEEELGFSFDPASEADDLGFSFEPAPELAATAAPVEDELGFSFDPAPETASEPDDLGFSFEPAPEPASAEGFGFSLEPVDELPFEVVEPEPEPEPVAPPRPAYYRDTFEFNFETPAAPKVEAPAAADPFRSAPTEEPAAPAPEPAPDPFSGRAAHGMTLMPESVVMQPQDVRRHSAPPTPSPTPEEPLEEDLFGFAFADPPAKPAAAPRPAPKSPPPSETTEIFARGASRESIPPDTSRPIRKPARVRLQYRERSQLVLEYRENLRKGGAIVRTKKPLATGRECVFEVSAPGLTEPLVIPAHVTRVLADGMEVAYDIGSAEKANLLAVLG